MSVLVGSNVNVIDNSGVLRAKCLEIYRVSKYKGATVGCIILISVKKVLPNKKVRKGDLIKAVVVRSKDHIFRLGNHFLKMNDNAVILLNNTSLMPRAKRCKTPLLEELRFKFSNGIKVLSLSPVVL